jgi:tRNA and rRNA cytosine-C5-methylases
LKEKRADVQKELAKAAIKSVATPYSPWGLRIEGKPALTKLDAFTRGAIEVQDEGSQLLALLLDAKRGEMVVDFCAGAGGKTLAIGATMRSTGRLYAFDVSAHRLDALKPRLARSGLSNVHPAAIAHERDERIKRLAGKMDRVLVDAPCSGLGTLRRNPDLKWRQSAKSVQELVAKQTAILDSAARLLKPGGRLVYATCSILPQENEAIAEAFSAAHPDFEMLDAGELLEQLKVADARACAAAAPRARDTCACGRTCTTPTGFLRRSGPKRPEKGERTRDARLGAPGSFTLSYPISGGAHRLRRLKMGLNALPCTELTRGVALQSCSPFCWVRVG